MDKDSQINLSFPGIKFLRNIQGERFFLPIKRNGIQKESIQDRYSMCDKKKPGEMYTDNRITMREMK